MILPLVQDLLNESAKSLRTRFPNKYEYIKTIAKEVYPHIEIEEHDFNQDVNAQRMIVGQKGVYWLIMINGKLSSRKKYTTLVHELIHCYTDEIRMLSKDEEEKLIINIENNLFTNFNNKNKNDNI
jgi:hypothetical protein